MIKIFTDISHYESTKRSFLNDILKPLIPVDKLRDYSISPDSIKLVNNIQDCDICLLPMAWNYYLDSNKVSIAKKLIVESQKYGKKIIIGVYGDYYIQLPDYKNIIGMYASFYKSFNNSNDIPLPVIINDPLKYLHKTDIELQRFNKVPSVGFCGQIDSNFIVSVFKFFRLTWKQFLFISGLSYRYSGPITPPTLLRKRVLNILEKSNKLDSRFIRRQKYQGGVPREDVLFNTIKKEFYQNINDTDYTVCIRGTGNFSARFYETLAVGRIPVFIDSDSTLPFNSEIDWKRHLVWVKENELSQIEDKILQFHYSLSKRKFQNLQKENRIIWEKYFYFPNFYKQLLDLLKSIL